MRAEKTSGAKIALFNAGEDFARILHSAQSAEVKAERATLNAASYIVAIGERSPEADAVDITADGDETIDPTGARAFDTYGDALKWLVENCEITDVGYPVPRGYERPRFPRVCYLRVFAEVTDC